MKIGIIGTGVMSSGIAQVFITKGYEIRVVGRNNESLISYRRKITHNLDKLGERKKISD